MDAKRLFLLPGEYFAGRQPHRVSTLLGSCVAVCLYNRRKGFGGINHYLLPHSGSGADDEIGRYGASSIRALLNLMRRLDPEGGRLEAMVFGGAAVMSSTQIGQGIGEKNIAIARQILASERIPIVREQVGGDHGLKLHYQTWDNQIKVRNVEKSAMTVDREKREKDLSRRATRLLVVDDAPLVRRILSDAVGAIADIEVVGQAQDAYAAREKLLELKPDVMTLDIIMPKMDGVSFLKRVMRHVPLPTIVISTIAQKGSRIRQNALDAGAVDVIDKNDLSIYKGNEHLAKVLGEAIRKAARTVVRKKAA
jgi:two-component system chemotaxis response regulator CheB